MIYQSYQRYTNWVDSVRQFSDVTQKYSRSWLDQTGVKSIPHLDAHYEQLTFLRFSHTRPDFKINVATDASGVEHEVIERRVHSSAFCGLQHFKKRGVEGEPKILLVAPMSGHFATLLAGTVRTLLQDHEVYLTDWFNIRDVAPECGTFDLDAYATHIVEFMRWIGPGAHLMGVCQPTVACLVAAAVMAEDKDPCQPLSLTLMAGPVDARINPTKVNELATEKPFEWFEKKLISTVPQHFAGGGRRVYPGFLQLTAFMSMNTKRHAESFKNMYAYRVSGQDARADVIRDFYEEYFAIMDLSADFYLETIKKVFQEYDLPRGLMTYKGCPINLAAIRKPFLLTVEGERDDICGIGQTLAAQDLCSGLPGWKKSHHLQAGVGHYGVFNGKKWESQIYPVVRNHIQSV